MQDRTKALLINGCVTAGLLIEWYRGAPMLSLLIVAVIFFPLANFLMYRKRLAYKNQKRG